MCDHAQTPLVIERAFRASIDDVWALWTTKEGIESWWGPDGFETIVRTIDVRPGGRLEYTMTATARPQVQYLTQAGMPLSTDATISYLDVEPHRRLTYVHVVDFIPNIAPYDVKTLVEFHEEPNLIRMIVTLGPMHDQMWSQRAATGWLSQLQKLERALQVQEAMR